MGNATFWYQPDRTAQTFKIDLGRKLREREGPNVSYRQSSSESYGGDVDTRIYGGRADLRVMLTWQREGSAGTDAGSILRRKLLAFTAHLKRGGSCTFAEDVTYAWAAFASRPVALQDTTISYRSPVVTSTIAPASTPLNREIYIHTDPDLYLTEMHLCSVLATQYVTVDRRTTENYADARWILLRESGTYPALRMPLQARGQPILTHRDERVFFLDLPLEEDHEALESLARTGGQIVDEDSPVGGGVVVGHDDDWMGQDAYRYRW